VEQYQAAQAAVVTAFNQETELMELQILEEVVAAVEMEYT